MPYMRLDIDDTEMIRKIDNLRPTVVLDIYKRFIEHLKNRCGQSPHPSIYLLIYLYVPIPIGFNIQ